MKIKSQLIYLRDSLIRKKALEEVILKVRKNLKEKEITVIKILIKYKQYKFILKDLKKGILLLKYSKNDYKIILKNNN